MKKILLFVLSVMLITTLTFCLVACDDEPNPTPSNPVTVQLDNQNVKLSLGGTATLVATVNNSDKPVTWSTSKSTVATVANGVVTAQSVGTATITATVEDVSASCVVTVIGDVALIRPYVNDVVVGLGQAYDLSVTTFVQGEQIDGLQYQWTSVGSGVNVTYNQNKDVATFRGASVGATQFTVSATVYGVTVYSNVNVTVVNTLSSWVVQGYGIEGNESHGYDVNLKIGESTTPSITLLYNDAEVDDVLVKWTAGDNAVATIADGVITGNSLGTTTLSCLVDGEFTITFNVNVVRPHYEMPTKYVVETYDGILDITDEISGTIQSVTLLGKEVLHSANGRAVDLDLDFLSQLSNNQLGKDKQLVVTTDMASYSYLVDLYTKVITTAQQFKNMSTYMNKSVGEEGYVQYKGYVVLGNDVDLSSVQPFTMFALESAPGYSQGSNNGDCGFNGLFDGMGYGIYNYTAVSGGNGLFDVIGKQGEIRNVAFVDVAIPQGAQRVFCTLFSGKIHDVYVSIKQWQSGCLFHNWYAAGQSMSNVVVEYTGPAIEGERELNGTNGHLALSNVYVVGDIATVNTHCISATVPHAQCVSVFASYAQLLAQEPSMTDYVASLWNVTYGIPVIDYMVEQNQSKNVEITNDDEYVSSGSTLVLKSNLNYVTWALTQNYEGVSIDGNALVVSANAPSQQVTVVASNLFDDEKTDTITLQILSVNNIHNVNKGYLEIGNAQQQPNVAIDLSAFGQYDSIVYTKIGNANLNAQLDGNSLLIPKADLQSSMSQNVTIETLAKSGDNYARIFITGKVVTKVISTAQEFVNVASYLDKSVGSTNYYKYEGYVVLANDIDLAQEQAFTLFPLEKVEGVNQGATNADCGFNGVLDGNGYAIKNYTAGEFGLFNTIGENAIIKNIAILDVVATDGTKYVFSQNINPFVIDAGDGKLHDIYLSIKTWESGALFYHPYAAGQNLSNIVVYYNGTAIEGARDFNCASGHTARENVYFVGEVATLNINCDKYPHDTCIHVYASLSDMLADNNDYSAFTASVWDRMDVLQFIY